MNPVQIVTIKSKTPLFKGEEQANTIEKIELEENGFSLVSQMGLYEIGDKAVYIQPDFSLSDIPLFESFIRPYGETKKSKLGSNFRIRAVKFNLHTGDHEPTYSVGILLPFNEVQTYIKSLGVKTCPIEGISSMTNLDELLGITKWEEPDKNGSGMKTRSGSDFPSGIYKTDENNINNLWSYLEKIGYPIQLVGTEKVDGSSISIINDEGKVTVGSRSLIKHLKINKVTGRRKPTFIEKIKILFGKKVDLNIRTEMDSDDDFVLLAKPYINKMKDVICNNLVFRGEAIGQSWKGSGNKNNPNAKLAPQIMFYGVDYLVDGIAKKASFQDFRNIIYILGFDRCKEIFDKTFNSREEIEKECKEYFKNNLIEGIVVRTPDCKFSAKFMNDEYDSKK